MAMRSDAALSTLLLTSRISDVDWELVRQVESPERLLGCTSAEIASSFDLEPQRAERIALRLSGATQLAFAFERLDQQGYRVLPSFDDGYVESLRRGYGTVAVWTGTGPNYRSSSEGGSGRRGDRARRDRGQRGAVVPVLREDRLVKAMPDRNRRDHAGIA